MPGSGGRATLALFHCVPCSNQASVRGTCLRTGSYGTILFSLGSRKIGLSRTRMVQNRPMAPEAGLEPATFSLTANCSTIELLRNSQLMNYIWTYLLAAMLTMIFYHAVNFSIFFTLFHVFTFIILFLAAGNGNSQLYKAALRKNF